MRLRYYLNELAMKAGTEIRVLRDTQDRYEARISLVDPTLVQGGDPVFDLIFKFYGDYGSFTKTFDVIKANVPKLIPKLDKKGLVEWTDRDGRYAGSFKQGWVFSWEVYFEDEQGEIDIQPKRKGAAIEVFSALEVVIKKFLTSKKPPVFHFSSNVGEGSRVKLYKLLAKKISKSGYKVYTSDIEGVKYFVFYKG